MDNILNSDFVQWLIRFAFSKSGVVIRWLIGYVMGYVAAKNIIPSGDLDQLTVSLTSGLTALVAILYAFVQYWLNARHSKGVQVVQEMVGTPATGVVGNNTIKAVAEATGENPHAAIAAVDNGTTVH